MKNLLLFISITFAVNTFSQTTLIPDPNFEQALINLGYDTGFPDGSVPTANISSVTNLVVSSLNISSLVGIQDFAALTILDCSSNTLSTLDMSQNSGLTELRCQSNSLTSLDVTQNTSLVILNYRNNNAPVIDVSQNTSLQNLDCGNNFTTSLDVTQNTSLVQLACDGNLLTSLDVTQNPTLITLFCGYNYNNGLTLLDVTQNTALSVLSCHNAGLTSLDLSQNNSLTQLDCSSNQLTSLNVKNGINNFFNFFKATSNPNLTCITVDNVAWSNANWTVGALEIDIQSSFSLCCSGSPTSSTLTETALDSYNLNGTIYTQSGQFIQVIPNQAGCDSTITLNLTLNYTGLNELNSNTPKKLSKIVDLTGREIEYKKNTLMLYIYKDGSSERLIEFE